MDKHLQIINRAEAKRLGMKRYFTGKPCKHGHVAERFVSSLCCITCSYKKRNLWREQNRETEKEKNAEWYRNNREEHLARGRRWRTENKDRRSETNKAYVEANKDKIKSYQQDWYRKNKVHVSDAGKMWRKENKDKVFAKNKEWQRKNKHKMRRYARDYRIRHPDRLRAIRDQRRAAEGHYTADDISRMLSQQRHRCAACTANLHKTGYHVDHIQPLARGGTNWPSNLQLLCPACNLSKGAKDPLAWAQQNGKLL